LLGLDGGGEWTAEGLTKTENQKRRRSFGMTPQREFLPGGCPARGRRGGEGMVLGEMWRSFTEKDIKSDPNGKESKNEEFIKKKVIPRGGEINLIGGGSRTDREEE